MGWGPAECLCYCVLFWGCSTASRAEWEVPLGEHPVPAQCGLWLSHLWSRVGFSPALHPGTHQTALTEKQL